MRKSYLRGEIRLYTFHQLHSHPISIIQLPVACIDRNIDTREAVCDSVVMKSLHRLVGLVGMCGLFSCFSAISASGQATAAAAQREVNKAAVRKAFDSNVAQYKSDTNMLVLSGLLANRNEKWVKVQAEAVGIRPDTPCEFMLIAEASGHDYESLMISLAKPSAIHEALSFIGMKPGRPVDGARYCFWPKGERVVATVEWDNGKHFKVRGESLIVNRSMRGPLPETGFVFVGSAFKDAPNDSTGTKVYAADVFGPNSIVSYFNDFETVLDIPRVASQGSMYDLQRPNPDYSFATGQMVNVTFEPEHKDGKKRIADMVLSVTPPAQAQVMALSNVVARLTDSDGIILSSNSLASAMMIFEKTVKDGRDPFVRVDFGGELPLPVVRDICKFLDAIDTDKGIRIEPPPDGHAYYRAFVPDETLRDRANRAVQPWEFKLISTGGTNTGTLTLIEDKLDAATRKWATETRHFAASTPDAVRKTLEMKTEDGAQRAGPAYVFIFAPESMRYKDVAPFISACIETRPYIHVYLEK